MKTKSVAVNNLNVGDKIIVAPKTVGIVTQVRYGSDSGGRVTVHYSLDGREAYHQREVYWHGNCETKIIV